MEQPELFSILVGGKKRHFSLAAWLLVQSWRIVIQDTIMRGPPPEKASLA